MSTTTMPPTGSKGSLQLELFQPELSIGAASKKSAPTTSSLSCRPIFRRHRRMAARPASRRMARRPSRVDSKPPLSAI